MKYMLRFVSDVGKQVAQDWEGNKIESTTIW